MIRIKYCGNRSAEDVQAAIASGADYLGFIFAESKRNVSPSEVQQWLAPHKLGAKQVVGVFVNAPVRRIAAVADQLPLHVIQCHGRETPAELAAVKEAVPLSVWKAIHHGDGALAAMKQYVGIADGYVVDSRAAGAWGGRALLLIGRRCRTIWKRRPAKACRASSLVASLRTISSGCLSTARMASISAAALKRTDAKIQRR
ncbi:N-(5'-phosphoribosyl)anthranilate isomerase [Geobacillus sp. TFV-3]|nr:N-(5'-phosphoribosyl)anthranilate isomerase [Geobacillus sp. TFV-3]